MGYTTPYSLLVLNSGAKKLPTISREINVPQYYISDNDFSVYHLNTDTIFKFTYSDVLAKSGTTIRLWTLKNGNYITCQYLSDTYYGQVRAWIRLRFYMADGTPILGDPNSNWHSMPDYLYEQTDVGYYNLCCKDGNTNKDLFFIFRKYSTGNDPAWAVSVNGTTTYGQTWDNFINGAPIDSNDPYITAPDSGDDGGFGDFDYKSDIIPLPSAPQISVTDSGFITLYKPTLDQLRNLSAYLWTGLFDIATFKKIFADPMDCIISLALIPVSPTASGSQELKVGNIGTGITIDKLGTQFVEVNYEPLNIGLRANSFMDFSPYTKCQIYLPFIGTRSISIDDIAGRSIKLRYIVDLYTGACNAALGVAVTSRDGSQAYTTLYEFTGNVIADIPVTASNFASFLQSTISAVSTMVGVATGSVGALKGAASAINDAQSMKPDVEKSGNLSSTAGFLGVQEPYLILTYPNLCRPVSRDKTAGTPSFIGLGQQENGTVKKLSDFSGYTKMHKINIKSLPCTDAERGLIESQLLGGVILP